MLDGRTEPVDYLAFKDPKKGGTTGFYHGISGEPIQSVIVNGRRLPSKCLQDTKAIPNKDKPVYARCEVVLPTHKTDTVPENPRWFNCAYEFLEVIIAGVEGEPQSYKYLHLSDLGREFKYAEFNRSTGNVFDNLHPTETKALVLLLTVNPNY